MLVATDPGRMCKKLRFLTRNDAKAAIRRLRSIGAGSPVRSTIQTHMRAYRCGVCNLFHYGHLPILVMRGEMTMDEYEQRFLR